MLALTQGLMSTDAGGPLLRWRVFVAATRTTDGFFCTMAELQLRLVPGGAQQATGGTAVAGSFFAGAGEPANAFDGNSATFWATAGSAGPDWLGYILPSALEIRAVLIQAGDNAARAARAPRDFQVQRSTDGSAWTTVHTVTDTPAWGVSEAREFSW